MYGDEPIVGSEREWLPGIDWAGLLDAHAAVLTQLCDTARTTASHAWMASAQAELSARHGLSAERADQTIRSLRPQALALVLTRLADGMAVRQYPTLAATLDSMTPFWIGDQPAQVTNVIAAAVARVGASNDAIPRTLPATGFDERGEIVEIATGESSWTDAGAAPVRFTNNSTEARQVKVTINGVALNSLADVVFDTLALPAEHADEPLHRRAWRYMIRRHSHWWPISGGIFQHQADLYLRSVGLGFCDDAASVLARLWNALGHEARVIGLYGHVVPEVRIGDRWELYDPDYGVYYLNHNQQVAAVADLERDAELITAPIQPMPTKLGGAYDASLASLYTSANDNAVTTWQMLQSLTPFGPTLDVPAGASLEVRGEGAITVPTIDSGSPVTAATLLLQLPPGFTGTVRLPYMLTHATGDGSVVWREQRLDVASGEFVASIYSWYLGAASVGIPALEIERVGPQGLTLTMMVNPSVAPQGLLSVALSGSTVDGIDAVASTQ